MLGMGAIVRNGFAIGKYEINNMHMHKKLCDYASLCILKKILFLWFQIRPLMQKFLYHSPPPIFFPSMQNLVFKLPFNLQSFTIHAVLVHCK